MLKQMNSETGRRVAEFAQSLQDILTETIQEPDQTAELQADPRVASLLDNINAMIDTGPFHDLSPRPRDVRADTRRPGRHRDTKVHTHIPRRHVRCLLGASTEGRSDLRCFRAFRMHPGT